MRTWYDSREIATRLIVTGELVLESPAHLGNGDRGVQVDLPLLRDARTGLPLLQGSSLAGALRNYLRAYELGFTRRERPAARRKGDPPATLTELLFGGVKGDPDGDQSPLIIDEALATIASAEIRDGVRIDGKTRTAMANFKYDLEVLPPGTSFPLRFELLLPEHAGESERLQGALALALDGLSRGEIPLGARKSRGYGCCSVPAWQVTRYRLREERADLLAWLAAGHVAWGYQPTAAPGAHLAAAATPADKRHQFRIEADFELATPLLIRSEEPLRVDERNARVDEAERTPQLSDNQPDVIHLHDGAGMPVISGTSLAGALRARAVRILAIVRPETRQQLLDELFGRDMHERTGDPTASRLIVNEARITGGQTLVQHRVSLDRFTGGALDTALFSEAPQFGGTVRLTMVIREPDDAHKGLLLLLLKDLWTGDLPLGGTASVGRGRLRGIWASIDDGDARWELREQHGQISLPDKVREAFERYVGALRTTKEPGRGA